MPITTVPDITEDFLAEVAKGNIPGHSVVHKFGKNEAVSSSWEPVSIGGIYQTVQAASAVALRVAAGNVNDDAGGTGARLIALEGLDETGALVTEDIAPNGTSAGTASSTTFMRLFRAYVKESGTYATSSTASHAADIDIETAASATWLTIALDDFARGQSQVGVYTVPLGKTAYVHNYLLTVDSNQAVDFIFFKRGGILDSAAPYEAMRTVVEHVGVKEPVRHKFIGGQKFDELTDIGFMVKGTVSEVTVDFEILLVDN